MKKYQLTSSLILSLLFFQIFSLTAYANSSWVWISETRPYDILPWVIIGTLFIETISILLFAKVKNGFKVFTVVTIANLLSFAAPYFDNLILYWSIKMPITKYLNHWPSYTVGTLFCIVTVLIELPVVYFGLRKNTVSHKGLIATIIVCNILTTILVAVTERAFCRGSW